MPYICSLPWMPLRNPWDACRLGQVNIFLTRADVSQHVRAFWPCRMPYSRTSLTSFSASSNGPDSYSSLQCPHSLLATEEWDQCLTPYSSCLCGQLRHGSFRASGCRVTASAVLSGSFACLTRPVADQIWRTDHPPARGSLLMHSRPVVHSGFLRCWLADGLQQRVIQRVLEVAAAWQAAQPGRPAPVLLTGVPDGSCVD